MKRYLLDTNICAHFLNGQFDLEAKLTAVGFRNCCVSEITIAELEYGIAKSIHKERNRAALALFNSKFEVVPILPVLRVYATEKARLKTKGKILDDFDLLIGATAIFNNFVLVTRNVSDFERMEGIIIENWIPRPLIICLPANKKPPVKPGAFSIQSILFFLVKHPHLTIRKQQIEVFFRAHY